ncbi:phospholipase D family protein [Psychrobacillus sp. FSL H8-0483]|uniref:phospholipase D family protein n=1 Tax=Psychrobacillus sp. FSL H8-0483 TaxID=2921389 RepID=UPI00315A6ABF
MVSYFWKTSTFFDDFKKELTSNTIQSIKIASAYISIKGAQYLKETIEALNLTAENIEIYCSSSFNEHEPEKILKLLSTFSTVYIVNEPFLHTKVYEIHTEDLIVTYSGSANLTEGGLFNNFELTVKSESTKNQLEEFWDDLWQLCIEVNEEVIALYQQYPKEVLDEITQKKIASIKKQLNTVYEKQCTQSYYPDLKDFYFNVADYSILAEKYWEDGSSAIRLQRKDTQKKLFTLNEEIEPFAKKLDLYPHYRPEHLTSGIDPSPFNFYRVTGIWMRYGKDKSELDFFGQKGFGEKSSPYQQFHKHACLQLSIGSEGLNVGMFHSTASDGVDRGHVDDHWYEVKQKIENIYNDITGYEFVWHIYSNRENRLHAYFAIDSGTAQEFIDFYRKYDMDGFESFCMRHYDVDDERIKTERNIINEVYETFEAILPLYKAMTFRIPVDVR